MDYVELIKECNSVSDFCRKLGFTTNGRDIKKVRNIINDNKLDVSHFGFKKIKHDRIEKKCPICYKMFKTQNGSKEKTTCSCKCANTYFRSGDNHPNWKENRYTTTCFSKHEKKCVVCEEYKVIDVHHLDGNRENNNVNNLIPLCPTHHRYWHSSYRNEIEDVIYNYISNFIKLQENK